MFGMPCAICKGATTIDIELKACPFCGGDADVYHVHTIGSPKATAKAMCNSCEAQTGAFDSLTDAATSWNQRARSSP